MIDDANLAHKPDSARVWLEGLIVFALTLAFMVIYGDWIGFDGDDLNTVLPTLHLPQALDGDLLVYRYGWQPLSYWLSYGVYLITGNMDAIFAIPPVCMALGIALIYRVVRRHVGLHPALFAPLILLFPELIYNGFYFNATALGFPFAAAAVLLAFEPGGRFGAAATGALLGIAVLTRLDYILVAPAIALLRLWRLRDFADFLIMTLAGLVALLIGWIAGLVPIDEIVAIYDFARTEIIEKADMGGWNSRAKFFVTTTVLSPLGWLLLGLSMLWIIFNPRYWLPCALGLLSLSVLFFSARNMLTPKYMIPAFSLFPVLAAVFLVQATRSFTVIRKRILGGIWLTLTAFFLVASIEPRPAAPFITLTVFDPFKVNTHDGARTWGSIGLNMTGALNTSTSQRQQAADALFERMMEPGTTNFIMVGGENYFEPGAIAWRDLWVRLERAGYKSSLIAPTTILFDVPAGQLTLQTSIPDDTGDSCIIPFFTDAAANVDPTGWINSNC